jgi:hypothetical protein
MVPYRDGLVAATGGDLVLVDDQGTRKASFATGLSSLSNHVMEFALDTVGRVAYVIGPCIPGGGLTRVPVSTPATLGTSYQLLNQRVCGNRIILSKDRRLLATSSDARLSIVDAETGRIVGTAATSASVLDISFVRN